MDKTFLKQVCKNNYILIILGVMFSIFYSCIITAMPLVSKYLIDVVLATDSIKQVYIGIGIFFLVCILQPICFCLKEIVFTRLSEKIALSFRKQMFKRLSDFPISVFDRMKYGEISTKILSDTSELSKYINYGLNNLLTNILMSILLIVFMFLQNVIISSFIIVIFIVYFIVNKAISIKFKKISKESLKNNENAFNAIKQIYDKIILTKVFADKEKNNKELDIIFDKIKDTNIRNYNLSIILNGITLGVIAVALSLIYGVGALLIIYDKLTLGTVIALGLFFQSLTPSLNVLIMNNINYSRVKPSIKRINEFYNEPIESGELKTIGANCIKFKNVSFGYKPETPVLKNINIDIETNGVYGIIGASGSGKSTIAKLILGFYPVLNGELLFFERNINEIDKDILRDNISYVPQEADLLNDTIMNNILLGNSNASLEEIEFICEKLLIKSTIDELPDKYNTIITEKVNLSGGERKRIAICRAFIKKSPVYIFDEPEASLPIDLYPLLSEIYKELGEKSIVIVITHHSETLPIKCKSYYIKEGELVND